MSAFRLAIVSAPLLLIVLAPLATTNFSTLHVGAYRFGRPAETPMESLASNKTLDQFGANGLKYLPPFGKVLFANPASRFETIASPTMYMDFSFGIADSAIIASPSMASVEFQVYSKRGASPEELVWSRTLRPAREPKDRGLQSAKVRVNLSDSDQVIFETKAVADPGGSWAYRRDLKFQN